MKSLSFFSAASLLGVGSALAQAPTDDCPKCICDKTVHCDVVAILPPYFYENEFRVTGDFLYWQASEDNLEFAVRTDTTLDPIAFTILDQDHKVIGHDFKWHPGFRVGIGTFIQAWDGWDLYLNWTHIVGTGRGSIENSLVPTAGFVQVVSPLWGSQVFISPNNLIKATSHWDMRYDTIDLELGREFWVSKALSLRPHVGFRGAIINQDVKVSYDAVPTPNPDLLVFENTYKGDNDFSGFGLRGGSNLLWHFAKHWNIISQLSATLLYGKFDTSIKLDLEAAPELGQVAPFTVTADRDAWASRLNVEGGIGIQWEQYFRCYSSHLAISLLYEMSQWYDMNQFILWESVIIESGLRALTSFDPRGGNLGLQGFTLKVDFHF